MFGPQIDKIIILPVRDKKRCYHCIALDWLMKRPSQKLLMLKLVFDSHLQLQKLATLGLGYLLQFSIFLCFLESAEMEMKRKSPTCDCGSGSAPAWRRRSTISLKPETCDKFP